LLELGQDDGAERAYAQALERVRPLGEHLTTTWAIAGLGALRARQGKHAEAERLFAEADGIADAIKLHPLTLALRIRRMELAITREPDRREADARLREMTSESDHLAVRLPARVLRKRLEGLRSEEELTVQEEGRWFERSGKARVDLSRRKRLAAVLACLAQATDWVPLDAVFDAGWPGERCVPGSDVNRVHVTLSRLRAAGLGELIETDEGRFRIAPGVRLTLQA
ncbi:MAG: tetratricopeptide repeat protein, partial [Myxococcota bacterium]